tara:strand:- start:1516 stop:1761 length:246 start_codon:yes stop_codon:yes gene_type:complete
MSESGEKVNNEAPQEQPTQRSVSATAVLLSAVELAQTRGAYKMNEMTLITQAYNMVLAQEQQRAAAAQPASDETSEETTSE